MERSSSYSEAMKNPNLNSLMDSKVYSNDKINTKHRISQRYSGENKLEIGLQASTDIDIENLGGLDSSNDVLSEDSVFDHCKDYLSQTSDDSEYEEQIINEGLIMKIDVERHSQSEQNQKDTKEIIIKEDGLHLIEEDEELGSNKESGVYKALDDSFDVIEIDDSISLNNTTSVTIPLSSRSDNQSVFPLQYSSVRRKIHSRQHAGVRKRRARRVVKKCGEENVPIRHHIARRSIKYLRDVVTTLLNSQWRFIIVMFVICHFVFWLFFGLVWFGITQSYDDDYQDGKTHCVNGTKSFAGLFMMAVETQMTIGYGSRFPNEECPETITVMVIELCYFLIVLAFYMSFLGMQAAQFPDWLAFQRLKIRRTKIIAGTALSGGLAGLLFAKLTRPQKQVGGVGFSKKAVVCLRDGFLCLMFRVWDFKAAHTINPQFTAYLLKTIRTIEGEHHQNFIHKLELTDDKAFLLWPITVVHVIDENSPLYDMSAKDLIENKFEIVVCLTGASQSMGTVTQSRTSYLSKEIIWGYRFHKVLSYNKTEGAYVIDYENLDTVEQVDAPLCSASRLQEVCQDIQNEINMDSQIDPEESCIPTSPPDDSSPNNCNGRFSESSSFISPDLSPTLSSETGKNRFHGRRNWSFKNRFA